MGKVAEAEEDGGPDEEVEAEAKEEDGEADAEEDAEEDAEDVIVMAAAEVLPPRD